MISLIRNIGLIILLAAFAAGGYFVRDFLQEYEDLKSYKDQPEFASLPAGTQVQIKALEEKIMTMNEENETLTKKIQTLETDNQKYFEELIELKGETTEKTTSTSESKTETTKKEGNIKENSNKINIIPLKEEQSKDEADKSAALQVVPDESKAVKEITTNGATIEKSN